MSNRRQLGAENRNGSPRGLPRAVRSKPPPTKSSAPNGRLRTWLEDRQYRLLIAELRNRMLNETVGMLADATNRAAGTGPSRPIDTDLEKGATFDREGRATWGGHVRFEKIGACGHAARHAIKRAE